MSFQQPPGGFGAPPPRRSNAGLVISAAAAGVALLATVGVALWNFVLAPLPAGPVSPGPTPTITAIAPVPTVDPSIPTAAPSRTTEPPTPTPPPTTEPPPPPPAFPPGARPCAPTSGPVGGFSQAAAGTQVTSCPFAEEVRKSYGANPERNTTVIIPAYSPVTRETYDMTCSGDRLVTCTGGNNAVVYLI